MFPGVSRPESRPAVAVPAAMTGVRGALATVGPHRPEPAGRMTRLAFSHAMGRTDCGHAEATISWNLSHSSSLRPSIANSSLLRRERNSDRRGS